MILTKEKKLLSILIIMLTGILAKAQQKPAGVPDDVMRSVYDKVKTPYKYGLVMVPEDDGKKIDCPSVYRAGANWYMTYLVFDGRGYQTWLAQSADLLHWKTLGTVLSFSDTADWDNNQKAGYIALQDPAWGGSYALQKYSGKAWMSYFGGQTRGYEAGDLSLGMAYTAGDLTKPHPWQRYPQPVATSKDADVRWWENRKLYKSSVIRDKARTTGYPFVMYYNANGDTTNNVKLRWFERIGMSVSNDMIHWKRLIKEPVLQHPKGITGDPMLQKMGKLWVMFYFGAFWNNNTESFNRFACSYDLINWTDWNGTPLIWPSEAYDAKYAHKSFVIKHKGTVYHFYCAVDAKDRRGIAVATSKDMGKSSLHFDKK